MAVALSSCGVGIGPTTPDCDEVTAAILMEAQSVAGTQYAPCLHALPPGWEYENLEAKSGQTRFFIDSDRMGLEFLEVLLEATCDFGDATEIPSDEPGIPLYVESTRRDVEVIVVLVPEGSDATNRDYASAIADELWNRQLRGRQLQTMTVTSDVPTATRIATGIESGHPVLTMGTLEAEEGTVELHLPEDDGEVEIFRSISLESALDRIEDTIGGPRYEATWYYPFEGGCVTFMIDAHGQGVQSVVEDIQAAIGLRPLAPLREEAEQFGAVVP